MDMRSGWATDWFCPSTGSGCCLRPLPSILPLRPIASICGAPRKSVGRSPCSLSQSEDVSASLCLWQQRVHSQEQTLFVLPPSFAEAVIVNARAKPAQQKGLLSRRPQSAPLALQCAWHPVNCCQRNLRTYLAMRGRAVCKAAGPTAPYSIHKLFHANAGWY
jgi:hypothetical protein